MGKTKEELLGRVVWEVFPDFPENVYAGLHLSLTQNVPVHAETYNKQRKRWHEVHSYPSSEGLFILFQDMRERKRAESVVQARLRMLVAANRASMAVDEFLQVTLDEIEAQTGSTIGFYHFLEVDQETLSLQNWSTNTIRNMCTAEGKGNHYPISNAGVWVDSVHE